MAYLKQFKQGYYQNHISHSISHTISDTDTNTATAAFSQTDFPVFGNNPDLIWFDNGATTQKPSQMIDSIKNYYENYNSNIHRSPHQLSMVSSEMFDNSRSLIAKYIGCNSNEIVFVKGATEGINLLANSINYNKLMQYTTQYVTQCESLLPINSILPVNMMLYPKGTVLLSNMEHHSNIVPWQLLQQKGLINLEYLIFDKENNRINLADLEMQLSTNPSIMIVSITHVSNVLGITNPIGEIAKIVHKYGRLLIVDGAQGIPHYKVNVAEIGCDAYVFSSHKLFGPTGVGVVYCNEKMYKYMNPWQGGGSMIKDVTLYTSVYQEPPHMFEAGTPNIADIIAFGETIKYLETKDWNEIELYEKKLTQHLYKSLKNIDNLVILSDTIDTKVPVCSFVINDINDQALLTHLNNNDIAIRYGHHCAQPIIRHYGYEQVYRASLAPYNTIAEIDSFVHIIRGFLKNG